MNFELDKVKEWCDAHVNKLSNDTTKTNFIIIKSTKKMDMPINIQIRSEDGTCHSLVSKDHIKYSEVMIDDCISSKYHIVGAIAVWGEVGQVELLTMFSL